jgi:hypothetical protein
MPVKEPMSPKPDSKPLDSRAFRMIPDGKKKMTMAERKEQAMKRRDEMIAKFGHPKGRKNAG